MFLDEIFQFGNVDFHLLYVKKKVRKNDGKGFKSTFGFVSYMAHIHCLGCGFCHLYVLALFLKLIKRTKGENFWLPDKLTVIYSWTCLSGLPFRI